jgi:heme exporter protein A
MALMETRLWILDEPFTALDTAAITQVERILDRHVDAGGLLVLTSHQPVSLSNLRTLKLT